MMTKLIFLGDCPFNRKTYQDTGKLNHDSFLFESDISTCTGEKYTMLVPLINNARGKCYSGVIWGAD